MQILQLILMATVALHCKVVLWIWVLQHWELIGVEMMLVFLGGLFSVLHVYRRLRPCLDQWQMQQERSFWPGQPGLFKVFYAKIISSLLNCCVENHGLQYLKVIQYPQSFKIHLIQFLSVLFIMLLFYFPWHGRFLVKALFQWQSSEGKKWRRKETVQTMTVHGVCMNTSSSCKDIK